jgi:hypothetical protein
LSTTYNDQIIGAVGTSAGSVEQGIAVAKAAAAPISTKAKPLETGDESSANPGV